MLNRSLLNRSGPEDQMVERRNPMQVQTPDKIFGTIPWAWARLAALIILAAVLLMPFFASAGEGRGRTEANLAPVVVVSSDTISAQSSSGDTGKMSPQFSAAAMRAFSTLRAMRTHWAYELDNGFPLEKYWLASDREHAADALDLASLYASTNADQAALRELLQYFDALQRWSDDLLAANRELSMAQHYMSPGALQNDEQYQALLASEQALSARLGSVRVPGRPDAAEESSSVTADQMQ
jgi:hypothetical protein